MQDATATSVQNAVGDTPVILEVSVRARSGPRCEIWPRTVREPLPCIAIPLAASSADISLDLQSVFTTTYEDDAYDRDTDYQFEPASPLPAGEAPWAAALLRERGLRS